MRIPFVRRSQFLAAIEAIILFRRESLEQGERIAVDLGGQGYAGTVKVVIRTTDTENFETHWNGTDSTRFPVRIRAAATALQHLAITGVFTITHNAGILTIQRADQERDQHNTQQQVNGVFLEDHDQTTLFHEGKERTRLHRTKERNRKAVVAKKRQVLKATGHLACEVCDFDFAETYGSALGYGFAECHHRTPLSQLTENHATRLEELAIVCANCHRMIHKYSTPLTIEELRSHLKSTG